MNELTATVATRPCARRDAGIAPATSTCDMIQPPKMSPWKLASAGIGTTRRTGIDAGMLTLSSMLMAPRGSSRRGLLCLVAQFAPQNLPDVRLRQLVAEFDVARTFICGHVLAAILDNRVRGERRILPNDVQLDRFARFL